MLCKHCYWNLLCTNDKLHFYSFQKPMMIRQSSFILATERSARSWSQCTGRWLFKSSPAVVCRYFPPGLRSPSQLKNVTILRPVPSYTAWWERHAGVNNLPTVVTQLCPDGNRSSPRLIDHKCNALPLSHCAMIDDIANAVTDIECERLYRLVESSRPLQEHCRK